MLFVHDGVVVDVTLLRVLRTVQSAKAALLAVAPTAAADPLGFVEPLSPLATLLLHPPAERPTAAPASGARPACLGRERGAGG